jgi:DNA-binding NtrC family response regulator
LPERITRHEESKLSGEEMYAEHVLTLEQLEQRYIEGALKAVGGNKTQAAKLLGVDRRTLYRKLERYEAESAGLLVAALEP